MWDGWVDTENPRLHIVGHWNYEPGVVKPVYVVSNTDSVALFLNGKTMGQAQRDYHFLFTFDKIAFTPVHSRHHRIEFSALYTERECPEGGIQDMESEPEERNVPQPGY